MPWLILFLTLWAPAFSAAPEAEPDRIENAEGFSEILEPGLPWNQNLNFSGETLWRFRSDKPNSETFGSKTPPEFINPLYLYNRTSLSWNAGPETRMAMEGVFLRRDETSQGASEPPVNWNNWRKRYFLRHAWLGFQRAGLEVHGGDFLLGWGQGLLASASPSSPYRPFLLTKSEPQIKPVRSSYENIGLRGAAVQNQGETLSFLAALADTPLDGRISSQGEFTEDLSSLSSNSYGELGRELDLSRRDTLHERAALGRAAWNLEHFQWGISGAFFSFDRIIQPPDAPKTEISLPDRRDKIFKGNELKLLSADASAPLGESDSFHAETAASFWQSHKAPAAVLGWSRKQRRRRHSAGIFHLSPYFFSRLADAARLGDERPANRQGIFSAHAVGLGRHELGFQTYASRNIQSEFSGSALSHAPTDSRWKWKLKAEDRAQWKNGPGFYARVEYEKEPYLVHAQRDPSTVNILDWRHKSEALWERGGRQAALGWERARAYAQGRGEEKSRGDVYYLRSRLKFSPETSLYAKAAYFNLGPALFSSRFLYMSSLEDYWPGVYLGSIAYQSLFASYAPRGSRFALALEEKFNQVIRLWIKLGATVLSGYGRGTAQNTEERNRLASKLRLDFKTELSLKWQ